MTRSLSPLSFERGRKEDGEGIDAFADLTPAAADDSPALPPALGAPPDAAPKAEGGGDMFDAVEAAMQEKSAKPVSATITPFPALAKVTVVGNGTVLPEAIAEVQAEALSDGPPAEISGDMIEAIESDIASLLSSLNRLDDAAPVTNTPMDADDDWATQMDTADHWRESEDEAEEEPTLALLSELNRMWQADPEIIGHQA